MNLTPSELEMASVLYRDPCSYCGGPAEALDHIVPRYAGGERTHENLTAACKRCNSSKHVRPLLIALLDFVGVQPRPYLPMSRQRPPLQKPGEYPTLRPRPVAKRMPEVEREPDVMLPVEDAIEAIYQAFPGDEQIALRKTLVATLVDLALADQA